MEILKKSFVIFTIVFLVIIFSSITSCSLDKEVDISLDNENEQANNNEQSVTKIYALANIENANGEWNNSVMEDFCQKPIIDKGFVYKSSDTKWVLDIINIGDLKAENIEIKYTITAYEHMIEFGIDEIDVRSYKPIIFKEKTKTINVDKLLPGETKSFNVFYMGTFPIAHLTIDSIKYNDEEYMFEKYKTTYYYMYYEFNEIQDSQHERKLLGLFSD